MKLKKWFNRLLALFVLLLSCTVTEAQQVQFPTNDTNSVSKTIGNTIIQFSNKKPYTWNGMWWSDLTANNFLKAATFNPLTGVLRLDREGIQTIYVPLGTQGDFNQVSWISSLSALRFRTNASTYDTVYIETGNTQTVIDSAYASNDSLYLRRVNGSYVIVKLDYYTKSQSDQKYVDTLYRSSDSLYYKKGTNVRVVALDYYTKAESDSRYVLSPTGKITSSFVPAWQFAVAADVPNITDPEAKYLIVNAIAGDTAFTVIGGTGTADFTTNFAAVAHDRVGDHYTSFYVIRQSGSVYNTDRPIKYDLVADTIKFMWNSWNGQHMTGYGYYGYADLIYDHFKTTTQKDYKLYSFYPEDSPPIPFVSVNGAVQGGVIPGTSTPQVLTTSTATINYAQIATTHYLIQQGGVAGRGAEWEVNLGKKSGYLETWVGINRVLPGFARVLFYLDGVLQKVDTVRGAVQKLTYTYSNASKGKIQIVTGDAQNTSIRVGRTVWYQTDIGASVKLFTGGKILFVGDSWTQFPILPGNVRMQGLTERFKVRYARDGGNPADIINVGRGGMTSAWGKYYFKYWMDLYRPKYVYIEFYINDANSSGFVGDPSNTTWNFSSTDPYSAGTDVDGKVSIQGWQDNLKWMRDTAIFKYNSIPINLMNTPTGSITQTQGQSAWYSAFRPEKQYYDIEAFFTASVFADNSVNAPLATLTKAVIDTAEVGVVTRGGKPTVSGSYLIEAQATNSASTVGVGLYPKTSYTGSLGSMFKIWNNPTRTTSIFDVRNNGSVFATDFSASATGFTIPPFTITSNAGVVRFSATNSTTLNYLYLADSFRNTIRARIPLTLQNYSTSGLPISSFADKGSMAYDSVKNRPAYYDAFFWWSLAREEDMFKRDDTTTTKPKYIHNSTAFFGAPQTASIFNIGNVRLDFGSDQKWDLWMRDSATGNMTRIPTAPYGYTFKTSWGGKPEWVNEIGTYIRNGTATQTANFNINGNGVIGNTATVAATPTFIYPLEVGTLPSAGNVSAFFAGNAIGDPATAGSHFVIKTQLDSLGSNLNASNVVAGTLATNRGGTGLSSIGTALQQIRVNAGGTALEYFTASSGGSNTYTVNGRTGDYTFLSSDQVVLNIDNTAPGSVYTLPTAATAGAGKWYLITSERRNGTLPVTFSQTIYLLDGTTTTVQYPGNSILIVSDGANWRELTNVKSPGDIRAVTSNTTLLESDYGLICDGSSNSINVALPPAASVRGRVFFIKRIDNTIANTLNLVPNDSETIDGGIAFSTNVQWKAVQITSDGSNWFIIASNP